MKPGSGEPAHAEEQGEDEADRGAADHAADQQADETEAEPQRALRGQEHRRRHAAAHAGCEQPRRGRLHGQARVEPKDDSGERACRGDDHALVEAQPLEACDRRPDPAVFRRSLDRALAIP